ncbi:MAG: HAMP domain-containing sensor histidine kinase [Spirochaetes bacterium]|jgi:signal transduction histidine kinase|nr:HAMP domain-containing sensor histidine kinase [Spirochaetota bacterium]
MRKIFNSLNLSISFRIVVTFFVLWLVIILGIGVIVTLFTDKYHDEILANRFKLYSDYIVQEIGTPPSIDTAATIAEQTGLVIYIKGPGLEWASRDGSFDFPALIGDYSRQQNRFGPLFCHGLLSVERDGYTYLFLVEHSVRYNLFLALSVLAFLVLILALAALYFHYLLWPSKFSLSKKSHVPLDNLSPSLEHAGDEYADVTDAYNRVNRRLSELIKAKDKLLVDVSHKLKSPLARIKLAAEFIEGEAHDSIYQNVEQLHSIIDAVFKTFMTVYTTESLTIEPVNLVYFFNGLRQKQRIDRSRLKFHIDETASINADRRLFTILINNLLQNALLYSEGSSEPVTVLVQKSQGLVLITIRDYGIGIPSADLPYIFEPFYVVDKSSSHKGGTNGLGLTICKRIADLHGFEITASSTPGAETDITVVVGKNSPVLIADIKSDKE